MYWQKMMPLQSPYNSCLRKKIFVFNLLGSPGAGKTSLLEATLHDLKKITALLLLKVIYLLLRMRNGFMN